MFCPIIYSQTGLVCVATAIPVRMMCIFSNADTKVCHFWPDIHLFTGNGCDVTSLCVLDDVLLHLGQGNRGVRIRMVRIIEEYPERHYLKFIVVKQACLHDRIRNV